MQRCEPGLYNFGNTCYANSVLQALFYHLPLREHCIQQHAEKVSRGDVSKTVFGQLAKLFNSMATADEALQKDLNTLVTTVIDGDSQFTKAVQQDAEEFYRSLVNQA